MNRTLLKVLKKQVKTIEDNCKNIKNDVSNFLSEINQELKLETLKKNEREKILAMRFDLKKIRKLLKNMDLKLL